VPVGVRRVRLDAGVAVLGDVHRDIRSLQQRLDVASVLRVQRDAQRTIDLKGHAFGPERLSERVPNLMREVKWLLVIGEPCDEHGELVAAEPRHGHVVANDLREPPADQLQQGVTDVVSQGVVDLLETVEVEQEQRDARVVGLRLRERVAGPLHQHLAVRKAGEAVVQCLPFPLQ
jgi:hypothetical protein